MTDMPVRMLKYIGIFALIYAALIGVTSTFFTLMEIEPVRGTGTGIIVATTYAVLAFFHHEHQRVPVKIERNKLALGSLLASFLVSAVALHILLVLQGGSIIAMLSDFSKSSGLSVIILTVFLVGLPIFYFMFVFLYWVLSKAGFKAAKTAV